MKPVPILLLIVFFPCVVMAQTLSPTVVSTGGGFSSSTGYTLSHTEGELVVQTASASGNILTQGFQQAEIDYSGIPTIETKENITLKLYPNPTTNFSVIEIESETIKDFVFDVIDMKGAILQQEFNANILNGPVRIDLTVHAIGYYFIRVRSKNGSFFTTLKVQKIDS